MNTMHIFPYNLEVYEKLESSSEICTYTYIIRKLNKLIWYILITLVKWLLG